MIAKFFFGEKHLGLMVVDETKLDLQKIPDGKSFEDFLKKLYISEIEKKSLDDNYIRTLAEKEIFSKGNREDFIQKLEVKVEL